MNDSQKLIEQTLSSKEIFKGQLLHVFSDEARLPDNSVSVREWIKHPGASAIVPVFENGDVMLVRQFRYPAKQIFYETPAGKIDPGETPDTTAERELKEEAGLICQNLDYVGHFYPAIGYADEVIHFYVAWDIEEMKQAMDDDEFVLKERMPFREAVEMVYRGEITDAKTTTALLRSWHWWQQHEPFVI
ncbi:MAG TPA: NUDIX hydrolase [Balneolaceae bacterium]